MEIGGEINSTDGTQWSDAFRGDSMKGDQCDSFPEVKTSRVRFLGEEIFGKEPSLVEFKLYGAR